MPEQILLLKSHGDRAGLHRRLRHAPGVTRLWLVDQPAPEGMRAIGPLCDAFVALPDGAALDRAIAADVDVVRYQAELVTAQPGGAGGVVMVAVLEGREDVPRAEIMRHWHEHIPLALEVHQGLLSYRHYRFGGAAPAEAPFYAGLALLAFPSLGDVLPGLFRDPDDVRRIEEDVADFTKAAHLHFTTEHEGMAHGAI